MAKLSSSSISASASWSLVSSTDGGPVLVAEDALCSLAGSFELAFDSLLSCCTVCG